MQDGLGLEQTLDHLRNAGLRWSRVTPGTIPEFLSTDKAFSDHLDKLYTKVQFITVDWKWCQSSSNSDQEVHTPMREVETALEPNPLNANWYDLRFKYSRKDRPTYNTDMVSFIAGRRSLNYQIIEQLWKKANLIGLNFRHIRVVMDSQIFEDVAGQSCCSFPTRL